MRKKEDGYELVAGERRLRACKMAKMQTIPAILCDYADDKTAAMGLLENLQRENLNQMCIRDSKETRTLHLPGGDTRTLILCKKISQTPTAYPRNGGKIAKSPLK